MQSTQIEQNKYITFQFGTVYHFLRSDSGKERTVCNLPFNRPSTKDGKIATTYMEGCLFPTYHSIVPPDKKLCGSCRRMQSCN